MDAGSIASGKVLFSKVDGVKNAAEIEKSINVLMAIEWGRQAWNNVASHTINKTYSEKARLYAQEEITFWGRRAAKNTFPMKMISPTAVLGL